MLFFELILDTDGSFVWEMRNRYFTLQGEVVDGVYCINRVIHHEGSHCNKPTVKAMDRQGAAHLNACIWD